MFTAYQVTREQASSLMIGTELKIARSSCSEEEEHHLKEVYETVVSNYNKYVDELGGSIGVGACGQQNKIQLIGDETPLLHLINTSGEFGILM